MRKISKKIVIPGALIIGAMGLAGGIVLASDGPKQSKSGVPEASSVADPIEFSDETKLRQKLLQVALGKLPADLVIKGPRILNVFSGQWDDAQDIVISSGRIAWVGPTGKWAGKTARTFDAAGLSAVPGFGESHKHIESTQLSPEYEAALVIP
ncbi:MAG: hypothetical protein EOP83_36345, partial [Verrucomicrobiaceae bacterium]